MLKATSIAGMLLFALATPAIAWDGVDRESGSAITIEPGELVRPGLPITVYDADTGEYRDVDVLDMNDAASGVEVEVHDPASGELRMLEMEE